MDLQTLLPLLRCPRTGTKLSADLVSESGETYPFVNGKPVLVREIRELHLTAPREPSQNQSVFRPEQSGLVLHLGSGNVPSDNPNVVSLDIVPCENADLVAEAEYLPFADEVFDHVESSAVFEHVYDPLRAIAEVKRVLKPNGTFRIDTAFMQGYHGYPSHYFNMTPQAVETFLVGDSELLQSYVPDSGTPAIALAAMLERYVEYSEPSPTLQAAIAELKSKPVNLTEFAKRSLAASFVVVGRKKHTGHDRYYYAERMTHFLRHHEACYYRRLALEKGKDIGLPEASLDLPEPELREQRDRWITAYLS